MAAEAPAARSLLEDLVRALVNEPDEVKVEEFDGGRRHGRPRAVGGRRRLRHGHRPRRTHRATRCARSSRPPRSRTVAACSSTSSIDPELLHAGRVGRPHGLDGSLLRDRAAHRSCCCWAPQVWVGERETRVAAPRRHRRATHPAPRRRVGPRRRPRRCAASELRMPRATRRRSTRTSTGPTTSTAAPSSTATAASSAPVSACSRVPSCEVLELDGAVQLVPLVQDAIRSIDLDGAARSTSTRGFLGLEAE